jgi:hypothetical protein
MFIVYLNVCLDIAIRIFIGMHGKKKVCGKFLFFSGFSDMPWFLDLSLIIHELVKENVISEKPLKKKNFPHTFFLPYLYEDSNRDM